MQTLDWIIRHAETMYRNQPAIVDGDTRLSYGELGARCRRLGSALRRRGVKRGDRVATLLANSHRYLELHLTLPSIGAVVVPLNNRLSPQEMQYILDDSGASLLIIDTASEALVAALRPHVQSVLVCPHEYEAAVDSGAVEPLPGPESENSLAGLYYTGGTTGPAKGVMLTHRNLVSENTALGLSGFLEPDMTFLYVFPLFHLASIAVVYGLNWIGARQVFLPAVDPRRILATIGEERITHTSMVPTVINTLIHHPDAATADFSSLRVITHGAAPIAPDLCRAAVKTFRSNFCQAYGMTEASGVVTLLRNEQDYLAHERIRSAGRVLPGMEVVVRRPDGTPCDPREAGEITVRGPNIMLGYWNKPKQTAEVLRDGFYWSGDVGFLDEDHYLFIVDRSKDMIISGGENVYSTETEAALMSHEAVLECAVIGIPDHKWGEAVLAVVHLKPGHAAEEAELIAHCRRQIAGYKCPKSIEFVSSELPKSAVGKILKREIRAGYWAGRPAVI
ncbi:MAG: long-chain-fatty-acid--CoA ligase [Sinimarinibacterium sp.]|jgi:long-chain acyl-CoA synthetase